MLHFPRTLRLAVSAGLVLATSLQAQPTEPKPTPNILVIVADDLGYADLGITGAKDIQTPHIDSLAQNGVSFSDAYITAPVCLPSRMGIVTGRYQEAFGVQTLGGPGHPPGIGLPTSERSLGDYLQREGYSVGLIGKWHMGWDDEFYPTNRGFDYFYGFLGGGTSYLPGTEGPLFRNDQEEPKESYLTDAFGSDAVEFVRREQDGPWCLMLCFNAVHVPMEATEEYLQRYAHIEDIGRRYYAAMTASMDDNVGRVLQALKETGQFDDTLVFFFSDNGGAPQNHSDNAPLRGGKYVLYEGGIRTPFLVQWPNGFKQTGTTLKEPVIAVDVVPTVLGLLEGVEPEAELHGVDLMPLLRDGQPLPDRALYWRYGPYMSAIRKGDWKLIRNGVGDNKDPAWELYNLRKDPAEAHNLAAKKPKLLRELKREFKAWDAELPPPLFVDRRLQQGIIWWNDVALPAD
ncbi:MAG: sulfatase-like hydrolase/transferase [Verrucomicrobiota bacterium JB022]|nr:sulfatase-like hydrolase/transferase [Verrucomicrobiota bacterium JB022]